MASLYLLFNSMLVLRFLLNSVSATPPASLVLFLKLHFLCCPLFDLFHLPTLCFPFFPDFVYFESSATAPYQIRRIDELNKTPTGAVEAKVACYFRRRDVSIALINQAEKYSDTKLGRPERINRTGFSRCLYSCHPATQAFLVKWVSPTVL
ncbi:hypothetical protein CRM22_002498 [Opisthorchis felineus]|uniref:BAH domain-containing protein n=1 Tax=Opisthorchis felineus TaxID=147828 RepID=A0A4S2MC38_OPIFE|nr:hypothetical protein CRM22_002498 [Opisthorchis felineus]